jgi:hypothetical protein
MAELFIFGGWLAFVGLVYAILRISLGPGQHGAVAERIATGLLTIAIFGTLLVVMLRDSATAKFSLEFAFVILVILFFVAFGFWLLWISAYAIWFRHRPLVKVDDAGIRLGSAFYRLIPWADVVGIGRILTWGQEAGPFIFLADGHGVRTVGWPMRRQRLGLPALSHGSEPQATADLIRNHPNFRGKVIAP